MRSAGPMNVANGLTMLRILLVPVFGVALFSEARTAAFVVFVLAALTDTADGKIARRYGLVTDFGKLADPIADKALIGVALLGLAVLGDLPWWVTVLILAREFGITALRFWVRRRTVIAASAGGKAKTVLQVIAIALYVLGLTGWPHVVAMVLMGAAVTLTVITGLDYVVRAIRAMRGDGAATA